MQRGPERALLVVKGRVYVGVKVYRQTRKGYVKMNFVDSEDQKMVVV